MDAREDSQLIGLHQRFADYYQASGRRDKARCRSSLIVKLDRDDTALRYRSRESWSRTHRFRGGR